MSEIEDQLRAFGHALDRASDPTSLDLLPEMEERVSGPRSRVMVVAGLIAVGMIAIMVWLIDPQSSNDPSVDADRSAIPTTPSPTTATESRLFEGHALPIGSIDGESSPDLMRRAIGLTIWLEVPASWRDPSHADLKICTSLPEGWNECIPLEFVSDAGLLEVESRFLLDSRRVEFWVLQDGDKLSEAYAWLGAIDFSQVVGTDDRRPHEVSASVSLIRRDDLAAFERQAGSWVALDSWDNTPSVGGSGLQIRLDDIPMFIEGFDYGVRVLVDGDIEAERDLRDFPEIYGRNRRVLIPVPTETRLTVVSALSGSSGGATFPLDFANSCTTNVTVPAGETVRLTLDWDSGCLDDVAASRADEYGRRVTGQFGCGPAGGPGVSGAFRMNRDANVYVEVVADDGTETLLGRSATYQAVANIDTEFLLGIGFNDAEQAELRLIDADRPDDGPIVVGSVRLRDSNPSGCR